MKNDVIKKDLQRVSTVSKASIVLGCSRVALSQKLSGMRPWKITELLTIARFCNWTVEQFLDIIEYRQEVL